MNRAEIEEFHNLAKTKSESWMDQHAPELAAAAASPEPEADKSSSEDEDPLAGKKGDWDDLPTGFKGDHGASAQDDLSPQLEPLSVLEEERGPGACSPILEPISKYDPQDLLDPEEDERILRQVRRTLIDAFRDPAAASSSGGLDRSKDDAMFAAEKAKSGR